jgi:hypothetical protein
LATRTHIHRAIATWIAVIAIAIPATSAAAEPKNGPPFVAAKSIASASGEPKNVTPFVAATVHHHPATFRVAQPEPALVQIVHRPSGFDWGDAGIGGAATLVLVLLMAGGGAVLRHDGRRQEAHG